MNQKIAVSIVAAACSLFTLVHSVGAQTTAFTYQGQLLNSGAPANGNFDFVFELFNASTGGAQEGLAVTNLSVPVSNGLFVVTNDFGAAPWTGQQLWMQLMVRTNNGGAFAALAPRQAVTSTPYAIQALNASNAVSAVVAASANTVAASNITGAGTLPAAVLPSSVVTNTETNVTLGGAFNGNGSGLTNLNASQLTNGTVADSRLSTNVALLNKSQAFTGNNTFSNTVAISTAGGVGALNISGSITGGFGTPLSLVQNTNTASNASPALRVIGYGNTPYGVLSVSDQGTGLIAQFGNANTFVAQLDSNGNWTASSFSGSGSNLTSLNASQLASGVVSPTVLPGFQPSSNYSTVGGGQQNVIALISDHSAIGGGWQNTIGSNDYEGTIAGGYQDNMLANSAYAAIGGGEGNVAGGEWAAIAGGNNNTNYGNAGTIAGGQNNMVGNSYQPSVGGGYGNSAAGNYDTIAGGELNTASGINSTIGGGFENSATANYAAIGGGRNNVNSGASGTIAGGNGNTASGSQPVIGGGLDNTASGANQATVGGGYANSATANYAVIGGGHNNANDGVSSTIGGGSYNMIDSTNTNSFIGGGISNYIGQIDVGSAIAGGVNNNIQPTEIIFGLGSASFIGGGSNNTIQSGDNQSAIVGGCDNEIDFQNYASFIGGGFGNFIGLESESSIILGGTSNTIGTACVNSLVAGFMAAVDDSGSFVWSDSSSTSVFGDSGPNTFNARATGGVFFETGGRGLWVDDAPMASQAFVLQYVGDPNAKENFAAVDGKDVLNKVLALPMTSWNYKDKDKAVRHLGPMAQDFHAAFGLNGEDDKHIAIVDEGGVALAAIQGLNQKLQDESKAKDAEIEQLKQSVAELKVMVSQLARAKAQ